MFPHAGCLCSLSDPALTLLLGKPTEAQAWLRGSQPTSHALPGGCTKIGAAGVCPWTCADDIIMNDLKEVPKGTLVESPDDMKLRGPMVELTIQGDLDRLEGWTAGNLHNSPRRGCASGKEEPIEKIKAWEETTQGTPVWKGPLEGLEAGQEPRRGSITPLHLHILFFLPRDWE